MATTTASTLPVRTSLDKDKPGVSDKHLTELPGTGELLGGAPPQPASCWCAFWCPRALAGPHTTGGTAWEQTMLLCACAISTLSTVPILCLMEARLTCRTSGSESTQPAPTLHALELLIHSPSVTGLGNRCRLRTSKQTGLTPPCAGHTCELRASDLGPSHAEATFKKPEIGASSGDTSMTEGCLLFSAPRT